MVLLNLFGGKSGKMSELEYLARIAHGEIPGAKIRHIGPIEISAGLNTDDPQYEKFEKTLDTVPDEKDWYLISWNYYHVNSYALSLTLKFGDNTETMNPRSEKDYAGALRGIKAEAGNDITVAVTQYTLIPRTSGRSRYYFQGLVSMNVLELPKGASPEL